MIRRYFTNLAAWAVALGLLVLGASGCSSPHRYYQSAFAGAHIPPPPSKNGAATEGLFRRMEENAEAADFVLYEHDFQDLQSVRLNDAGKDHLKQIVARLQAGAPFPVIIERSKYSTDPRLGPTDPDQGIFNYEVHPNPELDNRRREGIAKVLAAMGVPHADHRVVVGHQLSPAQTGQQAVQGYQQFVAPRSPGFGLPFGPQGFGFGFGGFGNAFF